VKIILEVSDFGEHAGPPELVAEKIERALAFGYTIEVMKVPAHSPWMSEAKFVDVGGQMTHVLVGPIDVEFAAPAATSDPEIERTD
jgi:hypothetical protein